MIDHGTPAGNRAGCTSRLLCPNQGTSLMTCTEAGVRFRGDYGYRRRVEEGYSAVDILILEQADAQLLQLARSHGTTYGYKQGCRSRTDCPSGANGGISCTEAHRISKETWREYRRLNPNKPVSTRAPNGVLVHGTPHGYTLGCNNPATCPAAIDGEQSCVDVNRARMRDYKRRSRAKGLK